MLLFGRSIGSGPATWLAGRHRVFSLILMSAYTSIRSVARHLLGRIGQFLVAERFRNIDHIGKARCPVLLIHGLRDVLIPFEQSQELCEACTGTTSLVLPENMDHNSFDLTNDLLLPIRCFLDKVDYNPTPNQSHPGQLSPPARLFLKPLLGNRSPSSIQHQSTLLSWLFT